MSRLRVGGEREEEPGGILGKYKRQAGFVPNHLSPTFCPQKFGYKIHGHKNDSRNLYPFFCTHFIWGQKKCDKPCTAFVRDKCWKRIPGLCVCFTRPEMLLKPSRFISFHPPPDFLKKTVSVSAFSRIFGQRFESLKQLMFWENEKDIGKTIVDWWRHEPRLSTVNSY